MTQPCRYRTCINDAHACGLCRGHYRQQLRGTKLRPLQVRDATEWTPAEVEKAEKLRASGKTFTAIGKELGRSEHAVGRRIRHIGAVIEAQDDLPRRPDVPRCPRCWLALPHEQCLAPIQFYATRRDGSFA
jgi:hypothetical protein